MSLGESVVALRRRAIPALRVGGERAVAAQPQAGAQWAGASLRAEARRAKA